MSLFNELEIRSASSCELCGAKDNLNPYHIEPSDVETAEGNILACAVCTEQMNDPEKIEANHWRCLNDSMWSTVAPVQIVSWRMLNRLKSEGWPADLLDMMYLDEEALELAKALGDGVESDSSQKHVDCNGIELLSGDSVVVMKDLNVKGSSLVAKRGSAVRNITLDYDNPEQIEGKVDGQHIVLLTKFVKKSS